jgi:hypothetical protein
MLYWGTIKEIGMVGYLGMGRRKLGYCLAQ